MKRTHEPSVSGSHNDHEENGTVSPENAKRGRGGNETLCSDSEEDRVVPCTTEAGPVVEHKFLFLHHMTQRGLNLDEVKSAVQKGLRRKEDPELLQSLVAEWGKSLRACHALTFLFEDHCCMELEDLVAVRKVKARPRQTIHIMRHMSKGCRMAASLPLIAMEVELGCRWGSGPEEMYLGMLVQERDGQLDMGMVLADLLRSWREGDRDGILLGTKLVTVAVDVERRMLSEAGRQFVKTYEIGGYTKTRRGVTQLCIRLLAQQEPIDSHMYKFLDCMHDLSTIAGAHKRLALSMCAVRKLDQYMNGSLAAPDAVPDFEESDWTTLRPLVSPLPDYCVDVHTTRGKRGVSTAHMCPNRDVRFLDMYHGPREVRGFNHFWTEGVLMHHTAVPNPWWPTCMNMYEENRPNRTDSMTKKWYSQTLRSAHPGLFHGVSNVGDVARAPGVLLQRPLMSYKVFTTMDWASQRVTKGPYKYRQVRDRIAELYRVMIQDLQDDHVLPATAVKDLFLSFPLIRAPDISEPVAIKTTFKRNGSDMEADLVSPASLGCRKVSTLSPDQFLHLPTTVIVHFMNRYCLNVGDSGLYNVLVTEDMSQVYGLDMDEVRHRAGTDLIGMLFTKKPAVKLQRATETMVRQNKAAMYAGLDKLRGCSVADQARVEALFRAVEDL